MNNSKLRRAGFTLLEVLIAISLTTALMAAMYSALDIYYQSALDSYAEIERNQIARAILADLATDIKSVTFAESEEIDDEEESDLAEPDRTTYTNGLYGTATDLTLFVSRPDRKHEYVGSGSQTDSSERSSDAVLVRYFLIDQSSELGAALASQNSGQSNFSPASESVTGLGRLFGDQADMIYAIANSDLDRQVAASTVFAEEVSEITFEYFDGQTTQVEWDSTEQNEMPQAIIINLTMRTLIDSNDDRAPEDQPGWLPETTHRLVVPIPVADPYAGLILE